MRLRGCIRTFDCQLLFQKKEEDLITFKSRSTRTQIVYFLMRANSGRFCSDCKVIPGECLMTEHRLLVMDVGIRSTLTRKKTNRVYKVKWWNLNGENVNKLSEKIKTEGKWRVEGHSNSVWEEMAECIRKSVREALGVYKEGSGRMKGAWWWSEEVKGKVKAKQEKYKALLSIRTD